MSDLDRDIERLLREHKPEATGLELDRIKTRAMARAKTSPSKEGLMRSRLVVALLTLGLMAGGTSGVIAAKGGNGKGNASKSQYRPGKGCGDKNHTHTGPPGQNKKGNSKPCPPSSGKK